MTRTDPWHIFMRHLRRFGNCVLMGIPNSSHWAFIPTLSALLQFQYNKPSLLRVGYVFSKSSYITYTPSKDHWILLEIFFNATGKSLEIELTVFPKEELSSHRSINSRIRSHKFWSDVPSTDAWSSPCTKSRFITIVGLDSFLVFLLSLRLDPRIGRSRSPNLTNSNGASQAFQSLYQGHDSILAHLHSKPPLPSALPTAL